MKKLSLLILLLMGIGTASAQNYMVVDSERIFKSQGDYNSATTRLDNLAQTYQTQVDARFTEVEQLFNAYKSQQASLTAAQRQAYEQQIIAKENEAAQYQESIFGAEGTLMKQRMEVMQPIQTRVFDAIQTYAQQHGFALVLDAASNPSILYKSTGVDHTDAIIQALK